MSEVKAQYAAQVAADLEHNTKEQERIASELAALQETLAELQKDHALLVSMQGALDGVPSAAGSGSTEAAEDSTAVEEGTPAAVPAPRRAKGTGAGAGKPKKTAAPLAAGRKAKVGRPTFRELVTAHLARQQQPRSVSDVTAELEKAHPDRAVQAPAVRNALEDAVSRGQAERTKQGRSVYYTVVRTEPSAEPAAEPVAVEA